MSSYDVYVGNLSVSTSEKQLSKLFSQADRVLSVWIKAKFNKQYTYAFVKFCNLENAKNACELLNNQNVNGLIIKVSVSFKTQQRLSGVRKKTENASIIRGPKPRVESKKKHFKRNTTTDNFKTKYIARYKISAKR